MLFKKIGSLIICLLFGQVSASSFELPKEVRESYVDNIKEMCHSSVEYNLDMRFDDYEGEDGANTLYNETMECLFESAFVKYTNEMNKEFNDKFFKKIFDFKSPDKVYAPKDLQIKLTDCSDKTIDKVFNKQKENGYKTLCKIDGRTSTIEGLYSSCRVAEVVFNEFCAYQEYLLWKQVDQSVRIESELHSRTDFFKKDWSADVKKYNKEIDLSYRILNQTLIEFHNYAQNYRIHLWEKVIANSLFVTKEKFKLLKMAIDKWPVKFHNSAYVK